MGVAVRAGVGESVGSSVAVAKGEGTGVVVAGTGVSVGGCEVMVGEPVDISGKGLEVMDCTGSTAPAAQPFRKIEIMTDIGAAILTAIATKRKECNS